MNKTAAAAQLSNCILLHAYSRTMNAAPNCAITSKKFHIAYSMSWYNAIFGYKLITIEAENP